MMDREQGTALMEPQARLLRAADCAWFFDVDGTLVEIADTPDEVRIETALFDLLKEVSEGCGGAIALISGRALAEIDRLFAPLSLPAAGQHGIERRSASGSVHRFARVPEKIARIGERVRNWAVSKPGVLVEDKGYSVAVHFRQAPQWRDEIARLLQRLADESAGQYTLLTGKMVIEIKPNGTDKGTAVLEFMDEAPFHGRIPVFIGDDVTDEFAFSVVDRLGGVTVKVGPGESCARWRLADVAAVRAWVRSCFNGG